MEADDSSKKHVIIVGAGFAGLRCAHELVKSKRVHVTLIDKNNYHEFTPLLYQIATSALSSGNAALSLRYYFEGKPNIDIKMEEVVSFDPKSRSIKTKEGQTYAGDIIVLAAGSSVNFFGTSGAQEYSFPLYTLKDAERLRSRVLSAFEDADRNPAHIQQGVLNFVIVGAGPTGTEVAGALADMLKKALPQEFSDLATERAQIFLVDHGTTVLHPFSKRSQTYAQEVLEKRGVIMKLGISVKEVTKDHALLSNGETILSKTVIWAGGIRAAPLSACCNLPQGHGGRIEVEEDLTVKQYPNVYAIGDFASMVSKSNFYLPQLAAVATQCGYAAAKNILREIDGKPRIPFCYRDKGIMAMIGKNASVSEIGVKRRAFKGTSAFLMWLAIHASLLPTFRQKIESILEWFWDYFGNSPVLQILDQSDKAKIDWK